MSALFFPVLPDEAHEHPAHTLKKLRCGGGTSYTLEYGFVPFYRQEVFGTDLPAILKDSEAVPAGLWRMKDETFLLSPSYYRVPENYFVRYRRKDGSIFYVGTVARSASTLSKLRD